jgi:hypothetical protein
MSKKKHSSLLLVLGLAALWASTLSNAHAADQGVGDCRD